VQTVEKLTKQTFIVTEHPILQAAESESWLLSKVIVLVKELEVRARKV